jgi:hypothetical protein
LRAAPRTDPDERSYRIRLPPRVDGGEAAEAASRTRDARNDTPSRLCVRGVASRRSFPLADPLPSTDSAGLLPLFARFPGTMRSSDFPTACILGVRLAAFPRRSTQRVNEAGLSRFPCEEFPRMHRVYDCAGSGTGSPGTPISVWPSASDNGVGTPDCLISQLDGWPACAPVHASLLASRPPTQDSGSGWLAGPFPCDSCIHDSLPVSRRTVRPERAEDLGVGAHADVTAGDWHHCDASRGVEGRREWAGHRWPLDRRMSASLNEGRFAGGFPWCGSKGNRQQTGAGRCNHLFGGRREG